MKVHSVKKNYSIYNKINIDHFYQSWSKNGIL